MAGNTDVGSVRERWADRLGGHRPWLAELITAMCAAAVLAVVLVGLGLLITGPLDGSVGAFDRDAARWFSDARTSTIDAWSAVGTLLAETFTVIGVGLLAIAVCAYRKAWRHVGLLVVGMVTEATVFMIVVYAVDRPRPAVPRLETRATASYPSGHVAASIVLYVSLAIITNSHIRRVAARTVIWLVAALVPILVALSRLARGMHYVSDAGAGVLLSIGSLLIGLLAVDIGARVYQGRTIRSTTTQQSPPRPAQVVA